MRKFLNCFILVRLLFFSQMVVALNVTESFTSNSNKGSSTGMIWNIALGELHPPIQVSGWDDGGGATNSIFDVGDGRDGAFGPSRYEAFDRDGVITGGVIEIDTDAHPNLQLTSFNLAAGYMLNPIGSSPLVIRVLSTVQIDGEINCSGGNGQNGNTTTGATRSGGAARCGGGDGGASVPASVAPGVSNSGTASGTGPTGGAGGPIRLATGGQGGGGGGARIKDVWGGLDKPNPTDGDDSLGGIGGAVGAILRDDGFLIDPNGGGSGGGGGSGFDHPGDPINHTSGSGGGAGGGTIKIYSVGNITVSATGSIHADGGNGGLIAAGKGGSGGGGGGGSIILHSGGDILLDGPVTAAAGAGGATAGGTGGTGAWGRTWVVEKDGFASGAFLEDPESQLNVPGNVNYETGVTYTVLSKAIDMGNTIPDITSLPISTINLGGSTLTYEMAFSQSSDLSTLNNFALSSSYVGTKQKRFARFKIQIDNTNATTPVSISELSFIFDGNEVDEFNLTASCGRIQGSNDSTGGALWFLLFLLLPVYFRSRLLTRSRVV